MTDPGDPLRLTIPAKFSGQRLDRVLAALIPDHSSAQLQKMVRRGRVQLGGSKVLRSNLRVQKGQEILIQLESIVQTQPLLCVLHEDEHIVAVDKPAGLITHQTDRHKSGTLADLAALQFGAMPSFEDQHRPGIVHRLDRDTSGVILLARTQAAMDHLRDQFRQRTVEKHYLALVQGIPSPPKYIIEQQLGPDSKIPDRQRVLKLSEGRRARTQVELLEEFESCSLVSCRPSTGRRHQIRVALASTGHPILWDAIYGAPLKGKPDAPKMKRQALHASQIEFEHPATGKRLMVEAPLPADMQTILQWLRDSCA